MNEMKLADPACQRVINEGELLQQLLKMQGATILELGCGKAEKTRNIAQQAASILALEVDQIQLEKNLQITDLPNVEFSHGGAEKIPAADAQFDIVLMFKSLHHVPLAEMDNAFAEIHRVLKPGAVAYLSEPVFAGDFNEIIRLFNDEEKVRAAAFAAVKRAVASGRFGLKSETHFLQPMKFDSLRQFEEQVLGVTHTHFNMTPALLETVRKAFSAHLTPEGASFKMPIRVDLLQKI